METKTKRNIAIWVIVLLVLLNISSLSTIWYHRYQFRKEVRKTEPRGRMDAERRSGQQRGQGKLPKFLTEKMELTTAQEQTMDSIWKQYGSQREVLEDSMHKNRRAMFALLAKEELDTSAYKQISSSQMELYSGLDNSLLDMNMAIRATLTEAQRKMLHESYGKMQRRMAPRQRQPRERK